MTTRPCFLESVGIASTFRGDGGLHHGSSPPSLPLGMRVAVVTIRACSRCSPLHCGPSYRVKPTVRSRRVSELDAPFRLIAEQQPLKERLNGMAAHKMHEGEVEIDADLVRRLIAAQLPHLRELPISETASTGTVNAIFRLGSDLSVRLPRVSGGADDLAREVAWLPKLAGRLPIAIPEPVATGRPGKGFPFP
jgi:hypothetical protein